MSTFIANQIIKQARISIAHGREKYKAYFVSTNLYESWRADTEAILETEGHMDVITAV